MRSEHTGIPKPEEKLGISRDLETSSLILQINILKLQRGGIFLMSLASW